MLVEGFVLSVYALVVVGVFVVMVILADILERFL